jgi:hypothetical protein
VVAVLAFAAGAVLGHNDHELRILQQLAVGRQSASRAAGR